MKINIIFQTVYHSVICGDKEGNGQDRLTRVEFPLGMVKMFWNQVDLMVAVLYAY